MESQIITYQEFMSLAAQSKITLIDRLAAQMLDAGFKAAAASTEYYRIKLTAKDDPRLAVSALQSTLRAERELDK